MVTDPASRLLCSAELKRMIASAGHYGRSGSLYLLKMQIMVQEEWPSGGALFNDYFPLEP